MPRYSLAAHHEIPATHAANKREQGQKRRPLPAAPDRTRASPPRSSHVIDVTLLPISAP